MKNANRIFSFMLSLAVIAMMASCSQDDGGIDIGGGDGLLVADGFYVAAEGEDPVSTSELKSATVDAPDFGAMDRVGFMQGYMYLTTGKYNLVEVVEKEVVATIGGTQSAVAEVNNAECDASGYQFVAAEEGGTAFEITTDGLYVVAYDTDMDEIVFDQLESVGIIGGATPGGWSDDTSLSGTVTADGGAWSIEGVALEENEMKFRFNCRWAIDRRLDVTSDFANDNGYSFFTNFGGSLSNLLPGNEGANIAITERGEYTVTFTWDPRDGVLATATKTGDLEPLPDYPEALYLIGNGLNMADSDSDGTADGWQWELTDYPMIPVHSNPHLFWKIVWLEENGAIKVSPAKDWNNAFGKTGDATEGVFAQGGDDVPVPAAGYYMVVANMEDETIEINVPNVYGIGDAFGSDDTQWTAANENQKFTVDNDNGVISYTGIIGAKDVRIHVAASTLTVKDGSGPVDWWQAEFIVLDGKIEYRGTGDDQARAQGSDGGSVTLNFKDGTGTIN
ncbi:SusF/SusE family outer membrane protein [Reichenbachiella ulvae]|uniref:SusF/SusE family outer membrane protein n=1 Tax=Reichenbachiella ulvae TaxID=2980104 RepID=A0ABT3CS51_9BACT|nr:SusF/SusE family outer membrane protein [Reichenbachiella ulvae]MCV9386531.1 SusF/SusE family outer membrane protein [Reichenbachiella ulvae]